MKYSDWDLPKKIGYKTKIKYGIFEINDAQYLKDGALKLQLINEPLYQYCDSEEEAISVVNYESISVVNEGSYVILPVYVKEKIEL